MKMYELKITGPFIKYIIQGIKKAEGRIATDYVRSFKVGGKLSLISESSFIVCEITYLNFYVSFKEMLENEGLKNMVPFANNIDEAIHIYESFPGSERVQEMGCCAIGVNYLDRFEKFNS